MVPVLAVVNQKGGVGKTTSCVSIAALCAKRGLKVLLIDSDPQGNATSGLGYDKNAIELTTYNVIVDGTSLNDVVRPTEQRNLWLCPANINLTGAEIELVNQHEREASLKRRIQEVGSRFDLIFIDCPPSLGLLTLNALVAANRLLIPIQAEYYALEGVGQLLSTFELVKQETNRELTIEGVFITMFDKRTQLSNQVADEVKNHFKDLVYRTYIPRNVRLSEAPSHGKPIHEYDKSSKGAKAYDALTREIISRLKAKGDL